MVKEYEEQQIVIPQPVNVPPPKKSDGFSDLFVVKKENNRDLFTVPSEDTDVTDEDVMGGDIENLVGDYDDLLEVRKPQPKPRPVYRRTTRPYTPPPGMGSMM